MTKKEQELRQRKADAITNMRSIVDKADEEKRAMTAEEKTEYDKLDDSVEELNKAIEAEMRLAKLEEESRAVPKTPLIKVEKKDEREDVDPEKEFRNIGEMFHAIAALKRDGKRDDRLETLREKREQTMGTGSTGGYALPTQFDSNIKQIQEQNAIVRPRASVIAAGNPPDAKLEFPALDQTSAQNIYGGVVITHTGEGVSMQETGLKLREVTMEPKEVSAYIVVTNKLLNNWGACSSFVTGQMNRAMVGTEDYDFLRGDGINKPLGVINSAARIDYNRAAANSIAWADVYGMYARAKMGGSYAWLASQTIIPQLAAMVDAGSHAVWISGAGVGTGASQSLPSTLMGLPLFFVDRLPALGTKGDLCLLDLSYYLIKDGSGPFAASSDQLLFLSNKTVFKIVWNVDGRSWLTEPIGLEGSTSNTVSPFIILN